LLLVAAVLFMVAAVQVVCLQDMRVLPLVPRIL
jgi:hypothetical protein